MKSAVINRSCLVFIFATLFGLQGIAQIVSFPGSRAEVKSPDGHFLVRNVDSLTRQPAHVLLLIDTKTGQKTQVYGYGRHVDILWSPGSSAFAVNDYEGSSESHPLLFTSPWTGEPVDLRKQLLSYFRTRSKTDIMLENHHVYLVAERWLTNNKILCRLNAYGDTNPKGISRDYVYTIGIGFGDANAQAE